MKPCSDLNKLNAMAQKDLSILRSHSITISRLPSNTDKDIMTSFVCINLLNLWSDFSREYYRSLFLSPKGITGNKFNCNRRFFHPSNKNCDIDEAIKLLLPYKHKPSTNWKRREEPCWHDHNNLIRLISLGSLSNQSHIVSAFSLSSRFFSDLPVFRNYFAHRNNSTRESAVKLATLNAISAKKNPTEVLLSYPVGVQRVLISEWIEDISYTIRMLCD